MCHKHYKRWKKYGDPLYTEYRPRSMQLEEFSLWFWQQLTCLDNGCWEWNHGLANKYGYVNTSTLFELNSNRTHVIAWMLANNTMTIPKDKPCVLHSCDNPPCCNPKHLRLGTVLENNEDMKRRQRNKMKLTDEQVMSIRQEYKTDKVTLKTLAAKYGISKSMVSMIVNYKQRANAALKRA